MPFVKPRIFIGSANEALDAAVELHKVLDTLRFEPNSWPMAFGPGSATRDQLCAFAESMDFAVFLVTPEDVATSRGHTTPSPRDNIAFEIGVFEGRLGPGRTFMVLPEGVDQKMWSDVEGIVYLTYDAERNAAELDQAFMPASAAIKKAASRLGLRTPHSATVHQAPKQTGNRSQPGSLGHGLGASPVKLSGNSFTPVPLEEVITIWRSPDNHVPVCIAVGGAKKYDTSGFRTRWGMKEYQSTQPVTGVVQVAINLHAQRPDLFKGAYPDYDPALKSGEADAHDLIVVGGGDTNVIVKRRSQASRSGHACAVECVKQLRHYCRQKWKDPNE